MRNKRILLIDNDYFNLGFLETTFILETPSLSTIRIIFNVDCQYNEYQDCIYYYWKMQNLINCYCFPSGIWADDDSDEERPGFGSQKGKKNKDYTAPVNFVSGGVKIGDKVQEKEKQGVDAISVSMHGGLCQIGAPLFISQAKEYSGYQNLKTFDTRISCKQWNGLN